MNTRQILQELENNRQPDGSKKLPNKSGIYAIFLKNGVNLGEIAEGRGQIIYIGEAKNLNLRNHFDAKDSGFSTLRRSIGAILKTELDLKAIPRSSGSGKNAFKFNSVSERKISAWMHQNLESSFALIKVGYKELEKELVGLAEPLLNLTLWDNLDKTKIGELRSVCRDEAQSKK